MITSLLIACTLCTANIDPLPRVSQAIQYAIVVAAIPLQYTIFRSAVAPLPGRIFDSTDYYLLLYCLLTIKKSTAIGCSGGLMGAIADRPLRAPWFFFNSYI